MTRIVFGLLLLGLVGCGESPPTRSENDIATGKKHLQAALDSWKANEPEAKLLSAAEPIRFSDDFRQTRILVEYEIGAATVPDPRSIAFSVTIKTRDKKKNKEESLPVTYLVELSNPIRVSRDPYN